MKIKISFFLFFWFISSSSALLAEDTALISPQGLTLRECYIRSLQKSEKIVVQQKVLEEAEGQFYQALSGILPDISFVATKKYQDTSGANNTARRRTPEQRFTFSQPLFSGFKEFAAIAGSRFQKRQRQAEKKRAEELLFMDVSDAFYFFLSYQDQINTIRVIEKALMDRIDELKKREDLGRSRPSEVVSAKARLSRVQADLEGALGDWEIARQLLEFLVGEEIHQVQDEDIKDFGLGSLEDDLKKVDSRSDVKAYYEAWQVTRKEVSVSKAGFSPQVTADGNYYTKRVGTSEDVDWDATLTVEVPVFKGGENLGKFKEAKALSSQAELKYEEAKRLAVLDVQNAYTRLDVAIKKEEALRKAFSAADENYKYQLEDYQKNLVNNLEVLQALEDLQDARQSYEAAQNETKRLYWNLKVSTGTIQLPSQESDQ